MRITVDLQRCEGFASCVIIAPELFDLDDAASVAVVLEASPADEARPAALEAAASCPVRAITVLDSPVAEP